MGFLDKVGAGVRSYFNPSSFNAHGFRTSTQVGVMAMVLAEVSVYILLHQSARLGEIPAYIPDVLIMSISALEFVLSPFISWFGSNRRRNVMIVWVAIALVCVVPLFGTPTPETEAETVLCTTMSYFPPTIITTRAAIRLAILILAAVSCALARSAVMAHALAYLEEDQPSANTHMNLAIFLLSRMVTLYVGGSMLRKPTQSMPWLQTLFIVIKLILTLVNLCTYPAMPPAVDRRLGSERSFFRSLCRVLRSKVAVLQILAMSLLAAAMWGFGRHEADIARVKFHSVAGEAVMWEMVAPVRAVLIVLAVVLSAYLYTAPVMPEYEKRRALGSAARMSIFGILFLVIMMTAATCSKTELAGRRVWGYTQPDCARHCRCDRPWTSFAPVCDPQGMVTYFSPCHAGCGRAEKTSDIGFYSNCSCAVGGRATVGACGDGACDAAYALHTLLFTCVMFCAVLAITWQSTVLLESVDKRDKSLAIGLASGTVALFTFVGGHWLYMWMSENTCASFQGRRCLWHDSRFVPQVGYTTIGLVGVSVAVTVVAAMVLDHEKKEKRPQTAEFELTRD